MLKTYSLLTKPGIIIGNLITTASGFALASKGQINYFLFFMTLIGLGLVIASACVWNNYIDREIDEKMERTKNRALVTGKVNPRNAKIFASFLGAVGTLVLSLFTPWITVAIALFGLFIYVVLYSFWKSSQEYATLVGSVAGAIPIVVGYSAVTHSLGVGSYLLFSLMVLWQMPHFFAIALYRIKDYAAASIPVLPVVKGSRATQVQIVLYIVAFLFVSSLFTLMGYTGYIYLSGMTMLSIAWLALALKGFKVQNVQVWARKMFLFSLIVIMAQSFLMAIDFM